MNHISNERKKKRRRRRRKERYIPGLRARGERRRVFDMLLNATSSPVCTKGRRLRAVVPADLRSIHVEENSYFFQAARDLRQARERKREM